MDGWWTAWTVGLTITAGAGTPTVQTVHQPFKPATAIAAYQSLLAAEAKEVGW